MSTATAPQSQQNAKPTTAQNGTTKPPSALDAAIKETVFSYVPLGETNEVVLTVSRVKKFLVVPTKSGKLPTDEQVTKFIMLCKAQSLNPWLGDAHLVGYDSKDGPSFSLITAHQALLKRAEASPEFDGMESGVVVARGDAITERPGDLLLNGEILVGGWARVYRRDRSVQSFDAVNLSTFNTGRSRWLADPAGMIVKCGEASALRKAFPSTLSAMYCREEMDRTREKSEELDDKPADTRSKTERLTERLTTPATQYEPTSRTSPANVLSDVQPATDTVSEIGEQLADAVTLPETATERPEEILPTFWFAACEDVLREAGLEPAEYEKSQELQDGSIWQLPNGTPLRLANYAPNKFRETWITKHKAFDVRTTDHDSAQQVKDILEKCRSK